MRISISSWFVGLVALALAGFICGCSGGGTKEKVDVQAQISNLASANAETRVNALVELAKAGPAASAAVKPVIPLLKDGDALVRRLAAHVLEQIGPNAKEALPALKPLLNDGDRQVVMSAVNAMRAIDPKAKDLQALPNVTN